MSLVHLRPLNPRSRDLELWPTAANLVAGEPWIGIDASAVGTIIRAIIDIDIGLHSIYRY